MTEQEYYPPGGFHFSVMLLGSATALQPGLDASFQEVSGIQAEFETESVTEGGENRFVHRLPKAAKYPNLVLKRGIVTKDSLLSEWCAQTVGANMSLPIVPQNLLVTLLDDAGFPLVAWGFVNAYPVKWEVGPMSSLDNKILTESMEFSYNYFSRLVLGSSMSAAANLGRFAASLTK